MRNTSRFMIDPDTNTPLADVLKISRILDSFDEGELPEFDEKYMLGIFYIFAIDKEPYLESEEASSEFIKWFNEEKIHIYIQQMSDKEFQALEVLWQDVR